MKRFHVHVSVPDLAASIRFYSALFGQQPSVEKSDYAKWMLEDPRVIFAISARGRRTGVNHLGLQTDSSAELESLNGQLQRADLQTHAEKDIACCYARSDKYWVTDPAGVAWETFHSLGTVPTYEGEAAPASAPSASCCGPATKEGATGSVSTCGGEKAACCG
jgi:catechol 2,3-dioxygenase-like lactoylglutathione lyase family enzyme